MVSIVEPPARPIDEHLARWDRLIWRLAYRVARRTGADPDDVRQDIVAEALRTYHTFDPARSTFQTWMGSVVTRHVAGEYTRQRRQQIHAVRLVAEGGQDRWSCHRVKWREGQRRGWRGR